MSLEYILSSSPNGGALFIDGRCLFLSVCLSVCPVPDVKSRMEGHTKLKIVRNEAHDTGNRDPI